MADEILETIHLEHIPASHSVHVAVFQDVDNSDFLHQQLLARNAEYEFALIDASVITSRIQVLSAVFKAITAQVAGTMKTPNVHSEIVCSLSPTNNITESYRRHGITPSSRNLVIVKVLFPDTSAAETVPKTLEDVQRHLVANVKGTPHAFTDETLSQLTDWSRVRKYYKLNGVAWLDGVKDEKAKAHESDMLILGGMALRGL
ncbi:kinase binding protein CGI-121-domain-containing protein [Xylariaceae sp. FL0255]|nr:kinase binding protein CGI-121-domain-containing protein [Xylariaceae sp. FL0255]